MRNLLVVMELLFPVTPATAQDWNNLATSEAMNQVHATMRQHMIVNPSEEEEARSQPRTRAPARIDPVYTPMKARKQKA